LSPEQLNQIIQAITASKLPIEGDLRREIQGNLKRLQAIIVIAVFATPRAAGPWSTDWDQRPHPQRTAQNGWCAAQQRQEISDFTYA
jgi:hypothetical protein